MGAVRVSTTRQEVWRCRYASEPYTEPEIFIVLLKLIHPGVWLRMYTIRFCIFLNDSDYFVVLPAIVLCVCVSLIFGIAKRNEIDRNA